MKRLLTWKPAPPATRDDVGLSHVDDNILMAYEMETDMMELENTGEPDMDDFQEHFHAGRLIAKAAC